jgi:hypothetical protein
MHHAERCAQLSAIMSCPWPTADWQPVCDLWHPDGALNAHDGLWASSSGPTCTATADTRLELAPAVPVAACISSSALLAQQLHMTAPLFAITARLLLFLACRAACRGGPRMQRFLCSAARQPRYADQTDPKGCTCRAACTLDVREGTQRDVALAKLVSPAVPAANGQRPRGPFVPAGCLAVATRLFETVPLV